MLSQEPLGSHPSLVTSSLSLLRLIACAFPQPKWRRHRPTLSRWTDDRKMGNFSFANTFLPLVYVALPKMTTGCLSIAVHSTSVTIFFSSNCIDLTIFLQLVEEAKMSDAFLPPKYPQFSTQVLSPQAGRCFLPTCTSVRDHLQIRPVLVWVLSQPTRPLIWPHF